jgi:hypothetical protein
MSASNEALNSGVLVISHAAFVYSFIGLNLAVQLGHETTVLKSSPGNSKAVAQLGQVVF